jgi:hypothetical protein
VERQASSTLRAISATKGESLYWAKLRDWGVNTPEDAALFQLRYLAPGDARAVIGFCRGEGAISIPYADPEGSLTGKARYRFLGEFDGNKYHQDFRGVAIYFPPLPREQFAKLRAALLDRKATLGITEGEGKVIRAYLAGLRVPFLAIGGVNSICSKVAKQRGEFLDAALMGLQWRDRVAFLVFDYDGSGTGESSPNVAQAEQLLGSYLSTLGACVHYVRLGDAGSTKKIGLDDFIAAAGADAASDFEQRMADAVQRTAAFVTLVAGGNAEVYAQLCHLNTQFAEISGDMIELDTGKKFSERQFKTHCANRIYTTVSDNGTLKRHPVAVAWLQWRHRLSVKGIAFRPEENSVITHDGYLNAWRGFVTEPRPGGVEPWIEFKRRFFATEPHLERECDLFYAHLLQRPWVKQFRYPIIQHKTEGGGKSLLVETFLSIIGVSDDEHPWGAAKLLGPTTLTEPHADWVRNCVYAVFNETGEHGDARITQKMKHYITSPWVEYNTKYGFKGTVKNHVHIAVTTNNAWTHRFDRKARREMVFSPGEVEMSSTDWTAFAGWIGRHLSEILAYYLAMDLSEYNPKAPAPDSKAKADMAEAALFGASAYVSEHIEEGQEIFLPTEEVRLAELAGYRRGIDPTMMSSALRDLLGAVRMNDNPVRLPAPWGRTRVWVRSRAMSKWARASSDEVATELMRIYRASSGGKI